MSVCAIMLVKDEADIIRPVVKHLLRNVDHVIVQDNASTDGTREILSELPVELIDDNEVGYWQEKKTTALAQYARKAGHSWVLPCDADEVWYALDGRPIREFLGGLAPDIQIVWASLYNHLPTALDDETMPNPVVRIGWRQKNAGALPKVCARTRPDLVIHAGNHSASTSGTGLKAAGLGIRHYSWRTADQYLRKIRNGERAYAATTLPGSTGEHWRMWAEHDDDTVREHFRRWFWSADPKADDSLILDPFPS